MSVLHGGQAVIPWTVTGIPVGTTFLALFDQLRAGALEAFAGHAPVLQRLGLRQSFVGSAKDSLVHVDYHLPIDDVCRQFGSYVRLIAEEEETVSSASTQSTKAPTRNAFESMMMSQRALSFQSQLPARIDAPRNKKDEMFNDLVSLFEEKNWKWNDGGSSHGNNFVFGLRDTLWYIDGHHSTLEERSCPIPEPFSKFVGYNIPERSKHRKRQRSNLSYDTLAKPNKKRKSLPFSPSVQHVKNIDIMLQCEECDLWRLLFSKRKLSIKERAELQSILDDVAYSCGATLEELDLPDKFSCVHVKEHNCYDTIEKLYYSAGFVPICIYAEEDVEDPDDSQNYPMCSACMDKDPIRKRKS